MPTALEQLCLDARAELDLLAQQLHQPSQRAVLPEVAIPDAKGVRLVSLAQSDAGDLGALVGQRRIVGEGLEVSDFDGLPERLVPRRGQAVVAETATSVRVRRASHAELARAIEGEKPTAAEKLQDGLFALHDQIIFAQVGEAV